MEAARSYAKWQKETPPGRFAWKHNALRHSFISYRVAQVQNVAQVTLEAGTSPQMIFSNYRELVRPMRKRGFPFRLSHTHKDKSLIPSVLLSRSRGTTWTLSEAAPRTDEACCQVVCARPYPWLPTVDASLRGAAARRIEAYRARDFMDLPCWS